MRALAVILVLVGVAHAGEPSTEEQMAAVAKVQALTKEADALYRAARDRGDLAGYDACGEKYLEAAALMTAAGNDPVEFEYNASVCFAQGGSYERALAIVDELVRTAPKHKLVFHARMRAAMMRRAIGDWRRAADEMVDLATRYAGEREAYEALWDAVALYDVLGDRAAMERTAEKWIKFFGRKDSSRAAELALHLAMPRDGHEKPADAIRPLQHWLKSYGGKDRLLAARAYLALGEAELAAACPVKVDARGLCLAAPPRKPRPAVGQCAPDVVPVKVLPRNAPGVARAQAALKQAIFAGEAANDQFGAGAWHVDRAQLALAILPMEAALGNPMPALRFSSSGAPDPASLKAMSTWLAEWQRSLTKANSALLDRYPRAPRPGGELIAVGRASWLGLAAADMLMSVPVPPLPPKVDAAEWRKLYCDRLDEVVEPFRARAREQATACLAKANEAGIVDDARECLQLYERFEGAAPETLPPVAWGVPTPSRP